MQPGSDAEVARAAFSVACFLGLSDIHECIRVAFKWLHILLESRQPAVILHTTVQRKEDLEDMCKMPCNRKSLIYAQTTGRGYRDCIYH